MNFFNKPVIVLGHGVRASGANPAPLLELGIPVITSWQAADLVDNNHPNYFGRPGIYGQRIANKVLYEAEKVLAIGCRFGPYMLGYTGFRTEQKITMVDVDSKEAWKFNATHVMMEASRFLESFKPDVSCYSWMKQCQRWKEALPWLEFPTHDDTNGYINIYQFVARLQAFLRPDHIILVDNGGTMCPFFQVLRLKPPQRLLASGGLGEMGATLPGAIGASFAKGEVLAVIGDGSLMMNLSELQTIQNHRLPVKIIVICNDGYGMIKGTYDNLKKPRVGVDAKSGLGLPNFKKVGEAFGFGVDEIRTWADFDHVIPALMTSEEARMAVLHIDPEQKYLPKLQPIIKDGKITPARFDQMSPILPNLC